MMSAMDPPLHERVYEGLKEDYLAGHFVPGKKIDIQELATRYRSSKTPVREAAFIMVGEGLFSHHSDGGFLVPVIEPEELIELLTWHMQLMLLALSSLKEATVRGVLQRFSDVSSAPTEASIAQLASNIFVSLVEATGNQQATVHVRRLNQKIHYIRITDAAESPDPTKELRILTNTDVANASRAIRRRVETYHTQKILHLQKIMEETE